MKHVSRVTSVLTMNFFLMVSSCSTTPPTPLTQTEKSERTLPTAMPEALKQGVVCHKGVQTPPEGIGITQVKVLATLSGSNVWIGITNIKLNSTDKQLIFCFSGQGTFDFDFQEGAFDPVLGITFPSDAQWQLYQGFEWQGRKYGSWGLLLPGKADLSYPPGAFRGCARITRPQGDLESLQVEEMKQLWMDTNSGKNWSAVERTLPLTQLWLDRDKVSAKVTAMQFGDMDGIIVRVVRQP